MHAIGKALKSKIIGKTSDVLSLPKRAFYTKKRLGADSDVKVLKRARSYDNAPSFIRGVPTEAFKARSVAEDVKRKYKK